MTTVKLVSILALAIVLAAVVLHNTSPVLVRFLWLSGEAFRGTREECKYDDVSQGLRDDFYLSCIIYKDV